MTSTIDRTAGLRAARARDSADKRRRAREAIDTLEASDTPITAAAVAHAAGVSTWLIYTDGFRGHLDAARRRQTQRASHPPRTAQSQPAPRTGQPAHRSRARSRPDPPAAHRTRPAAPAASPATRRRDRWA